MNYFEVDALNYSTLAALDSNYPGKVFTNREKSFTSKAMDRGSLVDCLLTSPEKFKDQFIIMDVASVTSTTQFIIDYLVDNQLDYTSENLLAAARILKFGGSNWSDETILKRIHTEDNKKYYDYKKMGLNDITVISEEDYNQASRVVELLKTHEFSSWIFNPEEGVTVKFQVPVFWNEDGIECKGLIDILVIDDNKKVITPIDLKIKSDSKYSFSSSFIRYKYYLQAAWYTRGLIQSTEIDTTEYKINNFMFLVTSFEYPDPPLLYQCTDETLKAGIYGGHFLNGEKFKGINSLFGDYLWYTKKMLFDYPRELYENKGVIDIDFLKINE